MKGDHFVLQRWEEDGLWHWELHKGYSPHGAIALSSQGYASRSAAKRSIASACKAFGGASHVEVSFNLYSDLSETLARIRIDERTNPDRNDRVADLGGYRA